MTRLQPTPATIKQLFALSGNKCAFPNCKENIINQGIVTGEIAHIEGAEPKGPRFNTDSNDEYRRSFSNLFLLCEIHHKIIDIKIDEYPTEKLKEFKKNHENANQSEKVEIDDNITNQILKKFDEVLETIVATGEDIKNHISNEIGRIVPTENKKSSINPLFSKEYLESPFNNQVISFKKQVITDYEKITEYRPIISNFRKFFGKKYFVVQKYKKLKDQQIGDNIFEFTIKLIRNLQNVIREKKANQNKIVELEKKITDSFLPDEAKEEIRRKTTTAAQEAKQREDIEKICFAKLAISNEIISNIKKLQILKNSISKEEATHRIKKTFETKIAEIDEKIKTQERLEIEIKELSEMDFRKLTDEQILQHKENEDRKKEELKKLEDEVYKSLKDKTDYKNSIIELENTLTDIEKDKHALTILKEKFKNLPENDGKKLDLVMKTLQEIENVIKYHDDVYKLKDRTIQLSFEKLIPIIGDYGSGKSALIHHILNGLCGKEGTLPIFVPLGLLAKHDDLEDHVMNDLYEYIQSEYKFRFSFDDFVRMTNEGEIIFLLDALDEMSTKLDSTIAQTNLNHIINLAKNSVVILTSRETYLSEGIIKDLLEYEGLIKILDFDDEQINRLLHLTLQDDLSRLDEIKSVVNDERFIEFSRKPLFLDAIIRNWKTLKSYILINESVILGVLTDEWIKHDSVIQQEQIKEKQEKIVQSRQKISEILAFAEYNKGLPIGIEDIKNEVKHAFQYDDADALERLSQYYKDAIGSTFLINEENNTYRFMIKPIMEYFIARKIVNEIDENKAALLLQHVNAIHHVEIFDFIKGILDIEWAIKPHLLEKIATIFKKLEIDDEQKNEMMKMVNSRENKSKQLFNIIRQIGTLPIKHRVANLLKILHVSGNLPPRSNLSSLILQKADLRGADLSKSNISKADLSYADLTGVNFRGSDLSFANFSGAILIGANFDSALALGTNFEKANLSNSKIENTQFDEKTNLKEIIFNGSNFKSIKMENLDIRNSKFIDCNFSDTVLSGVIGHKCDFRSAVLDKTNMSGGVFHDADFRNACMINVNAIGTKFRRCKMDDANLTNLLVDRDTDFSSAKMNNTNLRGVNIRETNSNNLDLTHALGINNEEET